MTYRYSEIKIRLGVWQGLAKFGQWATFRPITHFLKSFLETWACLPLGMLSETHAIHQQSGVVTQPLQPAKPELFTVWPFTERAYQALAKKQSSMIPKMHLQTS